MARMELKTSEGSGASSDSEIVETVVPRDQVMRTKRE